MTVKKVFTVIIAVVALAGLTILILSHKHKTNNQSTSVNGSYGAVAACDVLTSSAAQQILGTGAIKETSPADQESTSDIAFSNCAYSAGTTVDPPHMASVAVRSAKDSTGAASNKSVFSPAARSSATQSVSGYGDTAYWDPGMGQLNILKGNNWYILSNFTGTSPTNGTATLAMAEQLAQQIKLQ